MLRSSVKLVLRTAKTNREGLHPIYLRVTINRKSSFISTGHYCNKKYWDESTEQIKDGHLNADLINADLNAKKREALGRLVDSQVKGAPVTAAQIKRASKEVRGSNIFDFLEQFKKDVAGKRDRATMDNYTKHLKKLELYHGSRDLCFEEIDPAYLSAYEASLRAEGKQPGYVYLLLRGVRVLFNAARKKGVIDCYPFGQYQLPEPKPKPKEYLSLVEVKKLEKHLKELTGLKYASALYFLFGCYTGLRVSDWRRFNQREMVRDGWVRIAPKKTGWVSMPIPPGLIRILPRLADTPTPKHEQEINDQLAVILPGIGITRHITTHCARHTFAVTMCAERGISCEVAAELMGITVKVCADTYYKITNYKIEKEVIAAWKGL